MPQGNYPQCRSERSATVKSRNSQIISELSPFENKQTNKMLTKNVKIKTIKCPEKEIGKNNYDFALQKDL